MKILQITMLFSLLTIGIRAEFCTNVEYTVAGNESLKLDAFTPDGKGPFPAAILVHGGGWRGGSKEVYITPLFKAFSDAGFTWFSINYRLAPTNTYPAAVDDVIAAILWVKAHARAFKVDETRIALVGESAGGHLVALVGAREGRKLGIAAVAPYYAPCDFEAMIVGPDKTERALPAVAAFLGYKQTDDQARRLLREASPITHVTRDMPPFLLIHGNKDTTVPYNQSVLMRDRIIQAGATCELLTIEGGPHGMNGWEKNPEMQRHKAALIEWLQKTFKR